MYARREYTRRVARSVAQSDEETAIFQAFLRAYPSFAVKVKVVRQPDGDSPDLITELTDGTLMDFELAEWLLGTHMAAAKRRERLAGSIINAIGAQPANESSHFRAVMLTPREHARPVSPAAAAAFRASLMDLITETDRRWPAERDLRAYSSLEKYLAAVHFEPLVVGGHARPWPGGNWIFNELPGGSYSPDSALEALRGILEQKIGHYAGFSPPTRLIVYYNKAVAYNTPYLGVEIREFADIAALAAQMVATQRVFEKIYLLNALDAGLAVYELYPGCVLCA